MPERFVVVWVCPKCGWTKPETLHRSECRRCGTQLIRITRKIGEVESRG